jgi:hypothetical protein
MTPPDTGQTTGVSESGLAEVYGLLSLKLTLVSDGFHCEPVIVTTVPVGPVAGVNTAIGDAGLPSKVNGAKA